MLETTALLLAVAAYGALYASAPGRQSAPVGPPRLLRGVGAGLTVGALVLSGIATQSAAGPVLVVTVMMSVASVMVIAGPFVLPDAPRRRPSSSGSSSNNASSRPAARPANLSSPSES